MTGSENTAMTDEQRMLADLADGLFTRLGPDANIADGWDALAEVGLPLLLLDANRGGFGGGWTDALVVLRLAGYHALGLPLAEAAIAAAVAGRAEGRGTLAVRAQGTIADGRFTGTLAGAAHAHDADYVVAPGPDGGAMVLDGKAVAWQQGRDLAGQSRGEGVASSVPVERVDGDVFALGALARTMQIAGALDAALARTVDYANERQQFGRALANFQAVQQNLASFACEAAAANCAAMGAAQAADAGEFRFAIAAAKLRANRAAGIGAALAHQVHGAIGFTQEYPLHPLTRRLWAWRSQFGNDSHWEQVLGAQVIAGGADAFWSDLVARPA